MKQGLYVGIIPFCREMQVMSEEYTKRNDVLTFVDMNKNHYPTEIPI
mgnify:CR=1 FL=1